jgi:hypothetical protein
MAVVPIGDSAHERSHHASGPRNHPRVLSDRKSEEERLRSFAPPCPRHGRDAPKKVTWNDGLDVRFVVCGIHGCDVVLLRVG